MYCGGGGGLGLGLGLGLWGGGGGGVGETSAILYGKRTYFTDVYP